MKLVLSILFLLSSLSSFAQYRTCSICINDPSDPNVTEECQKWLSMMKQRFSDYRLIAYSKKSAFKKKNMTCDSIRIWGGFHGASYMFRDPFELTRRAAEAYSSKNVHYDGSTCLVFNNVKRAAREAIALGNARKDVSFTIVGNQNIGVVGRGFFNFTKIKELPKETSKVTFKIENGHAGVIYGACTPEGAECGYATADLGAESDSNLKTCMEDRRKTEQRCCKNPRTPKWGRWSAPGGSCT